LKPQNTLKFIITLFRWENIYETNGGSCNNEDFVGDNFYYCIDCFGINLHIGRVYINIRLNGNVVECDKKNHHIILVGCIVALFYLGLV
jgi:hypothetical protein